MKIVRTTDLGDRLLIETVEIIDFGDGSSSKIGGAVYSEERLIGVVRTTDCGDCPENGIVGTIGSVRGRICRDTRSRCVSISWNYIRDYNGHSIPIGRFL